ncbi:MAG TPA: hypothetical protein PKE16_00090 [Hyphomicrobium sp.]|nr:hypothetical protein [Hyphomicrobium sp.]
MDYRNGRAHLALCTMFGIAACASTGAFAADLSIPNVPEDQEAVTVMPDGTIRIGAIKLKFGGFSEFATFWRSRNEEADVGSTFGGIPFGNSPLAHEHETRFSARQSRISALATGDLDQYTHLSMYIESDFLAAGTTSNSNESNSYTPRIRHFYGAYDNDLSGWHVLAGQTWSLLTTNTAGIKARNEDIPLTIDAQYVVGFNWTRNPQFRVVKDIAPWLAAGVSIESPSTQIAGSPPAGVDASHPGGSLLNSTANYSNDVMPDVVGKLAFDPGWGHYEIKGIVRGFTDRVAHNNNTTLAGGGGASASLPIIPNALELQASFLAGNGIGRYGSGQQPDVTFNRDGDFVAIPAVQLLTGLVAHPFKGDTVYAYGGLEEMYKKVDGNVGYGLDTVNNSGCDIEGGTCQAQTKRLWEITGGVWQDIYKGSFGRAAVGAQAEYIKREAFNSINGGAPTTDDMIVLGSFRYYPFK